MATKQHKTKALTPKFISLQVLSYYHSRGIFPFLPLLNCALVPNEDNSILAQMPTQTQAHESQAAELKLSYFQSQLENYIQRRKPTQKAVDGEFPNFLMELAKVCKS